jgi:hypothetical protein
MGSSQYIYVVGTVAIERRHMSTDKKKNWSQSVLFVHQHVQLLILFLLVNEKKTFKT